MSTPALFKCHYTYLHMHWVPCKSDRVFWLLTFLLHLLKEFQCLVCLCPQRKQSKRPTNASASCRILYNLLQPWSVLHRCSQIWHTCQQGGYYCPQWASDSHPLWMICFMSMQLPSSNATMPSHGFREPNKSHRISGFTLPFCICLKLSSIAFSHQCLHLLV